MERRGKIKINMQTGDTTYSGDVAFFAGDNNFIEIEVEGETGTDILADVAYYAVNQQGGLHIGNCVKDNDIYVINNEAMNSILSVVGDVILQIQLFNTENKRITASENINLKSCLNLDRKTEAFIDPATIINLKELLDIAEALRNGTISPGGGGTGKNGATFKPYVSQAGIISWTNDGGLANPAPVNIKGPKGDAGDKGDKGDKGDAFTYNDFTPQQLEALKGKDGATGESGADGFSPIIKVEDIVGGHKVTITDKNGEHVFDVMDGDGAAVDYVEDWDEQNREITLTDGQEVQKMRLTNVALLSDIGPRTFMMYGNHSDVQETNTDFSYVYGKTTKVKLNDSMCMVFWDWIYRVGEEKTGAWFQVGTVKEKFRPVRSTAVPSFLSISETVSNVFIGSSGSMQVRLNKQATIPANTEFYVSGMWLTTNMVFEDEQGG